MKLFFFPPKAFLFLLFLPNRDKTGEPILDWPTRKRIAVGTARGLAYLHGHCNPKIIHRDAKAANVLLDEDFEAVVGNFCLAKLVDVGKTNVTTQVRRTMGHIAPEYLSTGKSSEKTDVIMLLELVTSQHAIDFSRMEEEDDVENPIQRVHLNTQRNRKSACDIVYLTLTIISMTLWLRVSQFCRHWRILSLLKVFIIVGQLKKSCLVDFV